MKFTLPCTVTFNFEFCNNNFILITNIKIAMSLRSVAKKYRNW